MGEKGEHAKLFYAGHISTLALSYFIIRRSSLQRQVRLWRENLPDITPFYAVKCNNDPLLMRWMTELNPTMGFDCASINEINAALPLVNPNRIIYAQPCKKVTDIRLAAASNIAETVIDSPEEVLKLSEANYRGTSLVRLLVGDSGSKQPFGKKFGAPTEWLPEIYATAKKHNIHLSGFSFHVGSECMSPSQYESAIKTCAVGADIAENFGFPTKTIDIGGGFLHRADDFVRTATTIRLAQRHFPASVRWIAEPGRFLAAPTHTLYTTVIGKKRTWPAPLSETDPKYRITIDESVYGAFSNIPFDHQNPQFKHVSQKLTQKVPLIIFGRTCDSGDTIAHTTLEEPEVGDVLEIPEMGAYTTVTASEFNGFPKAERIYRLE